MDIKRQNFLILGVSKSGYSAGKYILEHGGKCILYEENKNEKITSAIDELVSLGAKISPIPIDEETLFTVDVVVISPGVPINHEVSVKAKTLGKRIIGELEFGFMQKMPLIVAVTGTNGKTTTVSLIDSILKNSPRKSLLLGNIGVPVTSKIDEVEKDTVCVTEVSSFQLEGISAICPHIACILNIAPDHLERHYDMQTYAYVKKRLIKNQKESEYTVLNYDDLEVRSAFTENKAKIIWISTKERVIGAYEKEDKIYYNDEYLMEKNELSLDGEHNLYNALFSVAVCKILGVENQTIVKGLKEFKGIAHRIERVGEVKGVKYFDDSKSTNTFSTLTAIKSMKTSTVLILGGSEKGESYENLFSEIKNSKVSHVILTGASRFNMWDCAVKSGCDNVTVNGDFYTAIKIASLIAKEGENVLLSPACASFDCFNNYEERGDAFKKTVGELS